MLCLVDAPGSPALVWGEGEGEWVLGGGEEYVPRLERVCSYPAGSRGFLLKPSRTPITFCSNLHMCTSCSLLSGYYGAWGHAERDGASSVLHFLSLTNSQQLLCTAFCSLLSLQCPHRMLSTFLWEQALLWPTGEVFPRKGRSSGPGVLFPCYLLSTYYYALKPQ